MPNILIRNIPEEILKILKERAARQHRSLQQELRALLEESAGLTAQEALAASRQIRRKFIRSGRAFTDSADLLREDRSR